MSYWDSKNQKMIDRDAFPVKYHPGWAWVDCYCCGGLQWGGDEPRECRSCNGTGWRCVHIDSGIVAIYPGGSLLGRAGKDELEQARVTVELAADIDKPNEEVLQPLPQVQICSNNNRTFPSRRRIRSYCIPHNEGQ